MLELVAERGAEERCVGEAGAHALPLAVTIHLACRGDDGGLRGRDEAAEGAGAVGEEGGEDQCKDEQGQQRTQSMRHRHGMDAD